MTDPIELPFPEAQAGENLEMPPVREELDHPVAGMAQAGLPPKMPDEEVPSAYTVENYYLDNEIAIDVLRNKYLAPGEHSPWQLWKRQAHAIAQPEPTAEQQAQWEQHFLSILEDFKFVPGGRIMHGAGREDIKTTLNNCYVVAIKGDSIKDIYQTINDEALTYKFGGGCGHDLSILRPSGDAIKGTGGASCGPIGFMDLFSVNTNTIAQHGRRGANMQTLRVDHPDIEKFIHIKSDLKRVRYSNISVLLTHEFLQAVEDDGEFDLRWGGNVYRTVRARDLWRQIISSAHNTAEPGLIFWDTMIDHHNGEYIRPLVSTNPCAEQPLPDGGCCNLGSINLERFVDEEGQFMMEPFTETVQVATRFLDNVIDYNLERHALKLQRENALGDRRIGLGILGLGDMFVRMRIKYDSDEALQVIDGIMREMRDTAYNTSIDLAIEKGTLTNFSWDGYCRSKFVQSLPTEIQARIQENGIRNVTILTVPPTGSGAIVAQVTSGIEPIFATSYRRRVKQNEDFGDTFREYTVYHPVIKNLFGTDRDMPDFVVTAHHIDPYFRVKMQGTIQKYVDSSISSTVNLPENIHEETVADIYMKAYHEGLKGITVYREGSREGILISDIKDHNSADAENKVTAEPEPPQTEKDPALAPETPTHTPANATGTTDSTSRLHPRHRQEITHGMTRRVRTGEGNLYITINEDEHGLCEIFTTIGKAGGLASTQAEAISRLISLALRSSVDAGEIVKQLKGISGPNPMWENGRLILSTPDAIGQALDDYLNKRPWSQAPGVGSMSGDEVKMLTPVQANDPPAIITGNGFSPNEEASKTMTTCPHCGGHVVHEAGCITCPSCGYSRC